ncbi:hypothetical protein L3Q82_015818 [Scortum barcoo]|uniref:Uncharacterized protein n=1 Tax=Scortum barcoo TaxID=214431 RepID=A0ACB8VNX3_9TELE|nr:hypothetical protein L3Q82_015818 [Scortum barcoo]
MTAPLDQLRDTRRKDSSTALKLMTATGDLDSLSSLNTGQQLLTVSLAPCTGSPALQSVMKRASCSLVLTEALSARDAQLTLTGSIAEADNHNNTS